MDIETEILETVAGNITTAFANKIPGLKTGVFPRARRLGFSVLMLFRAPFPDRGIYTTGFAQKAGVAFCAIW